MHVLIVGARGQLGVALYNVYRLRQDVQVSTWARPEHDITNPISAEQLVALQPDVVINCAAWTAVDAAEANPETAYAANALGPKHLADGCRQCGATLIQVSTNEVFAGDSGIFYQEYDQPAPRSIYARSKLAGELAARQVWDQLIIVRTAWLFSPGGLNFPSKICTAADKLGALRVVADECGNPSYGPDVAAAIVALAEVKRFGIYHIVNEGSASRFAFAQSVLQATGRDDVSVTPIAHTEWVRPADSPLHAVLVNQSAAALGIMLRPWQEALQAYVTEEGKQT